MIKSYERTGFEITTDRKGGKTVGNNYGLWQQLWTLRLSKQTNEAHQSVFASLRLLFEEKNYAC